MLFRSSSFSVKWNNTCPSHGCMALVVTGLLLLVCKIQAFHIWGAAMSLQPHSSPRKRAFPSDMVSLRISNSVHCVQFHSFQWKCVSFMQFLLLLPVVLFHSGFYFVYPKTQQATGQARPVTQFFSKHDTF